MNQYFSTFSFVNWNIFFLLLLQQSKACLRLFTKMIHKRNEFQCKYKMRIKREKSVEMNGKNVNIKICFMTSCVNEAVLQTELLYAFAFPFPSIRTVFILKRFLSNDAFCVLSIQHTTYLRLPYTLASF